jgi:hypothetical protein
VSTKITIIFNTLVKKIYTVTHTYYIKFIEKYALDMQQKYNNIQVLIKIGHYIFVQYSPVILKNKIKLDTICQPQYNLSVTYKNEKNLFLSNLANY